MMVMEFKKIFFLVLLVFCINFIFAVQISDSTSTEVGVEAQETESMCVIEDSDSYWVENNEEIDSIDDCYRSDGIDYETGETMTECCPENYECNIETGECEELEPDIEYNVCADIEERDVCNAIDPDDLSGFYSNLQDVIKEGLAEDISIDELKEIADGNLEYELVDPETEECGKVVGLGCVWDSDECIDRYDIVDCNTDTWSDDDLYTCVVESESEDRCDDLGVYIISWTAEWQDNQGNPVDVNLPGCNDGSKEIQCPQKGSIVPFFTFFNLITSMFLITGIYLLMREKRCL